MSDKELGTALAAQGDIHIATLMIVQHKLPLDTAGAIECERLIRELDENRRPIWNEGDYMRTTIYMAQGIVTEAWKAQLRSDQKVTLAISDELRITRRDAESLWTKIKALRQRT